MVKRQNLYFTRKNTIVITIVQKMQSSAFSFKNYDKSISELKLIIGSLMSPDELPFNSWLNIILFEEFVWAVEVLQVILEVLWLFSYTEPNQVSTFSSSTSIWVLLLVLNKFSKVLGSKLSKSAGRSKVDKSEKNNEKFKNLDFEPTQKIVKNLKKSIPFKCFSTWPRVQNFHMK